MQLQHNIIHKTLHLRHKNQQYLFSSKVLGRSVVIDMKISIACDSSLCFFTNASLHQIEMRIKVNKLVDSFVMTDLQTMAAAEPSDVGQHWSFVSGPKTVGDLRICSHV